MQYFLTIRYITDDCPSSPDACVPPPISIGRCDGSDEQQRNIIRQLPGSSVRLEGRYAMHTFSPSTNWKAFYRPAGAPPVPNAECIVYTTAHG